MPTNGKTVQNYGKWHMPTDDKLSHMLFNVLFERNTGTHKLAAKAKQKIVDNIPSTIFCKWTPFSANV